MPWLLALPLLALPAAGQDPLWANLPAGLSPADLDDPEPWELRVRTLLDGPDACVQLQGTVQLTAALFSPGGWLGPGERHDLVARGTFDGTLDHGSWTRLDTTWEEAGEGEDDIELDRVHPMVGRLPPKPQEGEEGEEGGGSVSISAGGETTSVAIAGGSDEALGLIDRIIADIDPAVTTAYVSWEEAERAVVLHQLVPLDHRQGDLEVAVRFPEGGLPTRLDADFPARIRAGDGLVKVTVKDAQLHLRGKATPLGVLPAQEGASMVLGVLGFTVGIEQRVSYERARACP